MQTKEVSAGHCNHDSHAAKSTFVARVDVMKRPAP